MTKNHSVWILRLAAALSTLFWPAISHAQFGGTGAEGLANSIEDFITNQLMFAMGGVVLMFVLYYGVRLILESFDEGAIEKTRKSFVYALFGFALLAAAYPVRNVFTNAWRNGTIIDIFPFEVQLTNILDVIFATAQGLFVLLIVFHAFRIIASQGEEGEVEKGRKGIIQNVSGVVVLLLSNAIVSAVAGDDPETIAVEIAGIINFLLVLIVGTAFLALIVAGVLLIVSIDEGLKDKAKKIVSVSLIAILIALSSFAILLAFSTPL